MPFRVATDVDYVSLHMEKGDRKELMPISRAIFTALNENHVPDIGVHLHRLEPIKNGEALISIEFSMKHVTPQLPVLQASVSGFLSCEQFWHITHFNVCPDIRRHLIVDNAFCLTNRLMHSAATM